MSIKQSAQVSVVLNKVGLTPLEMVVSLWVRKREQKIKISQSIQRLNPNLYSILNVGIVILGLTPLENTL